MRYGRNGTAIVVAALALLLPSSTLAQDWRPERNIEIIAPSAAGGGSDTLARLVQRILQENRLADAPLTVINKPGAGGAIAWTALSQSPGDGYHVAISTANLLTNHITGRSTLNHTDFSPLAQLFSEAVGVAVRADSSIKSATELLVRFKTDAGALSAAVGTSLGNSGHIALALAAKAAGGDAKKLKAVVFPAAAQGMTALLGGHVDLVASPLSNLIPHQRDGRIRILAVSTPQRLAGASSSVPTWRELGADVVIDNLRGVLGPKGMGATQTAWWQGVLARMTATGDWKKHLEQNVWVNSYTGAEGSRKILQQQYDQMRAGLAELGLAKH
jgi:putative tricarboxylic transport membrane protein